jgi:hypothetical protein
MIEKFTPPAGYRMWALHKIRRASDTDDRWSQIRWTGRFWVFHRGHEEHHVTPTEAAIHGLVYIKPVSVLDGRGNFATHLGKNQREQVKKLSTHPLYRYKYLKPEKLTA